MSCLKVVVMLIISGVLFVNCRYGFLLNILW